MGDSSVTRFLPPAGADSAVSCAVCGCRLTGASGAGDGGWRHFTSLQPGHDARGCRPHCLDALHDRQGRVINLVSEAGAAA